MHVFCFARPVQAQFIPELEVPLRYLSSWLPDKKMANEIEV